MNRHQETVRTGTSKAEGGVERQGAERSPRYLDPPIPRHHGLSPEEVDEEIRRFFAADDGGT